MTLSYIKNICNEVVVFAQSNTTNNCTNLSNYKSFKLRIKQVSTVSLISLSMVTGEVFAGDESPKSKASSGRNQEVTFEATALNRSLPNLIQSNPPITPPPSMPDLVSDDTPQTKSKTKSSKLNMVSKFKNTFKLRKTKERPEEFSASNSNVNIMDQSYKPLKKGRKGVAEEKQNKKSREVDKQVVLTSEEQKARDIDSSTEIAGIDSELHKNMVADLRQETSNSKKQLSLNGNMIVGAINDLDSNDNARSKISLEGNRIVETKDYSTSTKDLIVSEIVKDKLLALEIELQLQGLKEEEAVEAVEDILSKNLITDIWDSEADANSSTAEHQKVLTERARFIARAKKNLCFGSKAVSKRIKHRLSAREIGSMVAVSAGDEGEYQAPSYSIWSSGVFGSSKQKDSNTTLGYSSRIRGGSIGREINLSSDLIFGTSLSRLHNTFKYLLILNSKHNVSKTNTNILNIYSSATLVENINLQTFASVALSGKHGNKQDIFKLKSKLFSFESHLNYKLALEGNITLIPNIGFRYEYGHIGASDQILDSYVLHHKKSKGSTLSGEVGARVLFTPIKFSSDIKLIPTTHISLEKKIGGRGEKVGQQVSLKEIGGEDTVVSGNTNHEKLSTNIGGGLIPVGLNSPWLATII